MILESSRIWCTKIITWKKHLSSQIRPQKLKSDQEEEEQQQEQQTYVKDPYAGLHMKDEAYSLASGGFGSDRGQNEKKLSQNR